MIYFWKEVMVTYFVYKLIGTEWKNRFDEELCGAADTRENAELLVSALESIDPTGGHREIRTESEEVVPQGKYYILKLQRHECGPVCSRDIVGMADTLANAKILMRDISKGIRPENWEIRDKDWNTVD